MSNTIWKKKTLEKNAKNVDEALKSALDELGVTIDDVEYEVLEEGSKGFLGMGAKDAVIKVTAINPSNNIATQFITEIFGAMDVAVDVKIENNEKNRSMDIELVGENMGVAIGKRGDTLDALQYLTSLVVNKGENDYVRINLDTENYRQKRYDALVALAKRLAIKVEKNQRKFTLEPMTPYERRVIHATLQDNEKITTYSLGEEPNRRVVVALKNYESKGFKSRRTNASSSFQSAPVTEAPTTAANPTNTTTPNPTKSIPPRPERNDRPSYQQPARKFEQKKDAVASNNNSNNESIRYDSGFNRSKPRQKFDNFDEYLNNSSGEKEE